MGKSPTHPTENVHSFGASLRFRYPVRLLIYLRWIAIFGQTTSVLVSAFVFGDSMPLPMVFSIIGLATFVNLILTIFTGPRRRIPADQVFYYLLYDLGELGALLFVTGGLNNPFVILILAPVVIAAGFLSQKKGLLISFAAIFVVYILASSPYPLPWELSGILLPDRMRGAILIALIIAILFIGLYTNKIAAETNSLTRALQATEMALSREQRLSSLGALAAAAAHELGSPLTTITLIAKDLQEEPQLPLDLRDDVNLLLEQSYRCRDILQDLAKSCFGGHSIPHAELPITAAIQAVIHPHNSSGSRLEKDRKTPRIEVKCEEGSFLTEEPTILLGPEIIHGLGNIIQNALQFAATKVLILVNWTPENITISFKDDGPGYPQRILERLGNPYVSGRVSGRNILNGEEKGIHLGLGLFISQTLLAQRGAKLFFENNGLQSTASPMTNSKNGLGASCSIIWSRIDSNSNLRKSII